MTQFIKRTLWLIIIFPLTLHASFIESTMGAAVVNDATATYFNPAALTLLKSPQLITLGSLSYFQSRFTGQTIQPITGAIQSGSSGTQAHYFLPALYIGIPLSPKVTIGFASITNFLNKDAEGNSILRYNQSSSNIENTDLVTAISFKLNTLVSIGAGINFSYADFDLRPVAGIPSLNIPDSQSRNKTNGTGIGEEIGFLVTPTPSTKIGFNYRSAITYHLTGKSILETSPELISNNYNFNFWTPARSILSISHFVTRQLAFIGTVQRIQSSIFKNVYVHGVATQVGAQPTIVNVNAPFYLRDTWLLTLGSNYRVTPKLVIRIAGNYNQSAGNSNYQIDNGDSITLGTSVGYEIYKNIIIDGSYAHVFFRQENIHINTPRNIITGVNNAFINAYTLKLTFNA